jgi:transposase
MVGVCKIEISESEAELKERLRESKTASSKERIQLLYLLKSQQVESVTQAASILGRNRVTLERWLGKYRDGGIERVLASNWKRGRKRHIPVEADQKLQTRLEQSDGFNSYGAIQQWLKQNCGVEVSYGVVHWHVRYRLKAKLKVPRPVSVEQQPQQMSAFKKPLLLV